MGWRWQVNWISPFYRGETDPEQAEGMGCWPRGSSEESQPGLSRGHTVSWAPLEGPMAASSRVPLQGWVSSGGQLGGNPSSPRPRATSLSHSQSVGRCGVEEAPLSIETSGWRRPRSAPWTAPRPAPQDRLLRASLWFLWGGLCSD